MVRLFFCSIFFYVLSVFSMERIPDGIYDSARRWNYLPKEEIIRESLQGIPDFINSIPRQLWKKAKLAVRKDTLPGTELYPQDFIDAVYDFVPDMIKGVEGLLSACSEKILLVFAYLFH